MRALGLCLGLALGIGAAGCTDATTSGFGPALGPAAGDISGSAAQAYFPELPERLFFIADALCDGPGQTPVKRGPNSFQCESLPEPEAAAALILQYDGSIEELPNFVQSVEGRPTEQGYLVTLDYYIRVPLRSGGVRQIRLPNERITEDMTEFLTAAGGRPL